MNEKKRKKLRDILAIVGTPADLREVDTAFSRKERLKKSFDDIGAKIEKVPTAEQLADAKKELQETVQKTKGDFLRLAEAMSESNREVMGEFSAAIGGKLEALANVLSSRGSMDKDLSGFFKDFGVQLAQYSKSSQDTASLISNLKWNASQQLRDVNGSPINPAIAPFAVTVAYDDIDLLYDGDNNLTNVGYFQGGVLKAALLLTYDGSGNLATVLRDDTSFPS